MRVLTKNRQDEYRDEIDDHKACHEALCGCRNGLKTGPEPLSKQTVWKHGLPVRRESQLIP